ncbi:hypothetical protein H4J51_02610 [Colwellia sp. MB02u-18]|uniref:hypothetical protein n=1 Tax=unclassified Colwellia TaxID=196834 RepID=UPI0015F748C3|nr:MULTISPECIES: hypothetical protein [unclassified Colwellia]MBA6222608.1 hypothetical protein [Colwellia sp. MB3u-45]MBA6265911.1 hypothetical protein [Colwellia sp. MB3u-43]MBA6319596.1 hypothetical protein [Colwellia sp. MB02u-19]MBA6323469.1 hypothetical protein [Colwellia sp. MB02u-18]MBA6329695.1 hypothetical protein [Colwellia sp. MB02u-12]
MGKIKNIFNVGDKVGVYGWDEPGTIEKITPSFIRVDGVVKSKESLFHLDRPHFCKKSIVPTLNMMYEFFSDLPKELKLDELSLELSYEEYLEDLFCDYNDFDTINFDYDDDDEEEEEGTVGSGGILRLIRYLEDSKKDEPDSLFTYTDEDGYENFIVFDFFVTEQTAKGRVYGQYVSKPIFEDEGLEPIQKAILTWFESNSELHDHIKNGAMYRKSLLTSDRERSIADEKTYTELELVDKLLIKCLDSWPEIGVYVKASDTVASLLHDSPGDRELVRRLDILIDLILSEGENQVFPELEDIVLD